MTDIWRLQDKCLRGVYRPNSFTAFISSSSVTSMPRIRITVKLFICLHFGNVREDLMAVSKEFDVTRHWARRCHWYMFKVASHCYSSWGKNKPRLSKTNNWDTPVTAIFSFSHPLQAKKVALVYSRENALLVWMKLHQLDTAWMSVRKDGRFSNFNICSQTNMLSNRANPRSCTEVRAECMPLRISPLAL